MFLALTIPNTDMAKDYAQIAEAKNQDSQRHINGKKQIEKINQKKRKRRMDSRTFLQLLHIYQP